jgi:hypothetical protein
MNEFQASQILIAFIALFIAYNQWRMAQNKLKFELFDRRFKIYDSAKNLILFFLTTNRKSEEFMPIYLGFLNIKHDAKWILNSNVSNYLDELSLKAREFNNFDRNLDFKKVNGMIPEEQLKKQEEYLKWFHCQLDILDDKFSPFLKLQQ